MFIVELRKIKDATWKEMNHYMEVSKEIAQMGGAYNMFKSDIERIKQDLIDMVLNPILAPIMETLSPVIADIVDTIAPILQKASEQLGDLLGKIFAIPGLEDFLILLVGAGGKLLQFILSPRQFMEEGFKELADTNRIVHYIWKKLGDIFGFHTEGGGGREPGGPGPSGRQERLESIEWD